eukprot:COSAG02_NODE_4980_length_4757_cov_3.290253_6_plen_320_part_00
MGERGVSLLTAETAHVLQVTAPRRVEQLLRQQLDSHCKSVSEMLTAVTAHAAKTILVTNSQAGWVELSGNAYAPQLLEALRVANIDVVSSQALFAEESHCPFEWKSRCFAEIANEFACEHPDQQLQILSIGDGEFERAAAETCVNELSEADQARCMIKTIKFDDEPSVGRLQQQVDYCAQQMQSMIQHPRPMRCELYVELGSDTMRSMPERQHIHFPQGGDGYRENWGAIAGGAGDDDTLAEDWEETSKLTGGAQSGDGWRLLPAEHSGADIDMMVTSASEMMSSPGPPGMYGSGPLGCSAGVGTRSGSLSWITADGTL